MLTGCSDFKDSLVIAPMNHFKSVGMIDNGLIVISRAALSTPPNTVVFTEATGPSRKDDAGENRFRATRILPTS
jgi:hypothetical protein